MRRQLNYSSMCAAEDKSQIEYAPLAQLDRALVYGTKGWGFDSLRARQNGQTGFDRFLFSAYFFDIFKQTAEK